MNYIKKLLAHSQEKNDPMRNASNRRDPFLFYNELYKEMGFMVG